MSLGQFYILFIFLITVAVILLSIGIGWRLGDYTLRRNTSDKKPSLGSIVGAMLGLLGFILAFTFSITSSRYSARKQLVLNEANAIGTAVLRTDFLAEPSRTESRKLFKKYVNIRVEARQNPEKIPQVIADSEVIHDRLWSQVTANSNQRIEPELLRLYIESLNEVIDIHSERVTAGIQYRIPQGIWFILYFIMIQAMLAVGYEMRLKGTGSFVGALLLALMLSAITSITADLDQFQTSPTILISAEN